MQNVFYKSFHLYRKEEEKYLKKSLLNDEKLFATEKKLLLQSLFLAAQPENQKLLTKDPDYVDTYISGLREDFSRFEKCQTRVMQSRIALERMQQQLSDIMKLMDRFKVCPARVLKTSYNIAKRKLLQEGMTLCSFYSLHQPFKRQRREIIFGKFDANAVLDLIQKDSDQFATYLHQKALLEQMFYDPEEDEKHTIACG